MADQLSKSTYFPEVLLPEMINLVKGHSSLAKLCESEPLSFNGMKEFTFTLDKEVDLVAENGAKSKGGGAAVPVTIVPYKIEYGLRVSDEFKYASEEVKMNYLKTFAAGFAKKAARGLDIMAMHGVNPRTGSSSALISSNNFDAVVTTNVVTEDGNATADENMEAAVALVEANDCEVTGAAMSTKFRQMLANLTEDGKKVYPELAWGGKPGTLNGLNVDFNSTLAFGGSVDRAIIGDFENYFKWGYAKQIPIEVIEYGNPDNDETLGDLKGHNQVYLRGEMYIGWGILDADAFAIVKAQAGSI